MGKRKRQTSPGCIFQRGNKLYCKIRGKQYATGINATNEGWKLAYRLKDKLAKELLVSACRIDPEPEHYTIKEAFEKFLEYKKPLVSDRTMDNYHRAYNYIVTENRNFDKRIINELVQDFLDENHNLSITSKNIYLRSFCVFLYFAH
jgi:hypothetical protein